MDVFDLHARLVADYQSYTRSFIKIRDPRIDGFVDDALASGAFWPEPLLQLNPTFLPAGRSDELVGKRQLHPECARIFRIDKTDSDLTGKALVLHEHQRQAIVKAKEGRSLCTDQRYGLRQEPDLHRADRRPRPAAWVGARHSGHRRLPDERTRQQPVRGAQQVPGEGLPEGRFPSAFRAHTGQKKGEAREALRREPPDILLTNYMMLELLLTRAEDRDWSVLRRAAVHGVRRIAYVPRQAGADVALLIRRCRQAFDGQNTILHRNVGHHGQWRHHDRATA